MGTERRPLGFWDFWRAYEGCQNYGKFSIWGYRSEISAAAPALGRLYPPFLVYHTWPNLSIGKMHKKRGWISPPSTKFIENVIRHLALIPTEIFPAGAEFALDFILVYVGISYVEILDNPVLACTHILVSVEVKFRGHDYSSSHGSSGEISSSSALSLQSTLIAGMSINERLATQSAMCTSLSIGVNGLFALSVVH